MLDRLLGRAELRERIEALEEEKHHLERELSAESDRRADAVSERQTAEERINRLEDRVAELEDRIERARADGHDPTFVREEAVAGHRRGVILDRLASLRTDPEGAFTAYVADGRDLRETVRQAFGDRAGLVSRAAPCLAVADDAGLTGACLSVPVPPEPFATWDDQFRLERSWFEPTGSFALALVRSDLFALGEYEGESRVAFHGFDADLKGQHSKGGFSQARFERLRDAQIDSHLERSRVALQERSSDPLYVTGEGSLLGEFDDVAAVTRAVDATGDPEPALADAFDEFWTVQVRTL